MDGLMGRIIDQSRRGSRASAYDSKASTRVLNARQVAGTQPHI